MGAERKTGKIDTDYTAGILLQHVSRQAVKGSDGLVTSLSPDMGDKEWLNRLIQIIRQ